MASELRIGCLVELVNVSAAVKILAPDGSGTSTGDTLPAADAEGLCGQLLEDGNGQCVVLTFSGVYLGAVPSTCVRVLARRVLHEDLIVGPASNQKHVTSLTMRCLEDRGFCHSRHLLVAAAAAESVKAAASLPWARVPLDFEPHYLGRDSKEKTALVDWDSLEVPVAVQSSPLLDQDNLMSDLFQSVAKDLEMAFGIRTSSRTNLLVRQTFADPTDEALYTSVSEPRNSERLAFMSLIRRRRACVMQFLGPSKGQLVLIPKESELEETMLDVEAGDMVIFCTQFFNYSFTAVSGQATTLQTWFLAPQSNFEFASDIPVSIESLIDVPAEPAPPAGEAISVTGIATAIGGDSADWEKYFLMFAKAGGDTVVEHPKVRWDPDYYCDWRDSSITSQTGQAYTRHQGHIEGIELFDSLFFNIGAAEAAGMDPNQRKVLEISYQSLAMGGFELKSLQRSPAHIAVMVGVSGAEWSGIPHPQDLCGCGTSEAIISNRINFALNLKGASQTINTACSSGLVAVHNAKLFLKYKDFDPLVGALGSAVQLAYSPGVCCAGQMLSFKGRCFTFDKGADGYLRGEGCSSVFMQSQPWSEDAFALVAGSQNNQDGRSASITAPNGPSQEKCIQAALKEAKLNPPEVDCFECHGTGTALGDPIEIQAFKRIYSRSQRNCPLAVTSSKSNLGHNEGNAGNAGFVKCCLQVLKAEVSPNLHLRELNPNLDMTGFPALMETEGMMCEHTSTFAGVSSFGFGGTNSHGMAFGKHVGGHRGYMLLDARKVLLNKINAAPPPDVAVWSDDPEDWETSGIPIDADECVDKQFQVELLEHGKVVWREVVEEEPETRGSRFYLTGTFNDWGFDQMELDDVMPDLYVLEMELGDEGAENFQIVVDEDTDLIYYPETEQCVRKSAPVKGPGVPPGMQR
eukprot:CAMPEP_0178421644 /NCGR_PEP_ID=MMETSP0689_2-20121128/26753_1 /TAXON_ID=160604 /ORGANISM="Amphidinium massartii, Strain CS-259" /LENGTH=914 /DNA_ID=CAMNT_0020043161 /DNA_START=31 /DNA_END=2772 /DNA_ORIENTATION=+